MLLVGNDGFVANVGDGFLRPGEGVRIFSPIASDEPEVRLVMICRDSRITLRAWSSHGGERTYRTRFRRRKHYPANNVIFNDFYPGVDLRMIVEHEVILEPIAGPLPGAFLEDGEATD